MNASTALSWVSGAQDLTEVNQITKQTVRTLGLIQLCQERLRARQEAIEQERLQNQAVEYAVKAIGQDEEEPWAWEKLGRFLGKALVKHILRPVARFAIRAAMNVGRFLVRSLFTYVLQPLLTLIAGFVVANPITATVLGTALLAGGGYLLYKKLTGKADLAVSPPSDMPAPAPLPGQAAELPPAQPTLVQRATETVTTFFKTFKTAKFAGFGQDVDAYISEAAKSYGIPEDVLRGFVKMEGGWTGKMSPTGAIGAGQFIQSTWNSLASSSEGKAIGMTKITGATFRTPEDPRYNQRINVLATGLLAQRNAKLLVAAGLPITGENLYMLHNIGPGIIDVMLGRPASAATLLAMKQNGMLAGQDASAFLAYQKGRFNQQYALANTSATQVNTDAVKMADAVVTDKPKKALATVAKSSANSVAPGTATNTQKQIVQVKGVLLAVS